VLKPFENHMTINIYVLSTFVEGGVVGNMSCRLIIAIQYSREIGLNVQVLKEITDPLDFTRSGGKYPIFCF